MNRWPTKKLGEIAVVQMGQSPPGETYNSAGVGLPFFQGKAEFGEEYPTQVKWCSQPSRIADPGDILLSVRAPVGPTNFAIERCCIGRGLAAIRGKPKECNQGYIRYYLKRFEADIAARGVGSTFRAINRNDIERLELPVPPLGEQERIVKLLDEADELRKLRGKADRRTAALVPALFHEMFGNPGATANGNHLVTLNSLCRKISDGTHKTPTYVTAGVPFVTVKNIVTGQLDFSHTKFISEQEHFELTKRTKPEHGDILVSKDGTIGVPCPVDTDRQFSIFVSVALLKLKKELVDAKFLVSQFKTEWVQSQIREGTKGIAIKHLHLRDFRTLKLILPLLPLQRKFAARASEIGLLEAEQSSSRRRLDDLFQSLLHRAFNGEL